MSNFVLSACWRVTGITPAQKLVLISLADQANDDGLCWPSVKTIEQRTCLCERAVRKSLADLAAAGFLVMNKREGRSTYYTLTPALNAPLHNMHPAPDAPLSAKPLHQMHPTPAYNAPITIIEPSKRIEPSKTKADGIELLSTVADLSLQVAQDFLSVRKSKKAPLTKTALDLIASEAKKAGITTAQAIAIAAGRGWQSFNAGWLKDKSGAAAKSSQGFIERHTDKSWREGLDDSSTNEGRQ